MTRDLSGLQDDVHMNVTFTHVGTHCPVFRDSVPFNQVRRARSANSMHSDNNLSFCQFLSIELFNIMIETLQYHI